MERQYPLVSIITTTYRKFDNLFKTIESVFKQEYPNIEYIITDDGSENFPEDQILNFINRNNTKIKFTLLHHNRNIGTVKNMNEACKISKGDYFINLSCGDIFFDEFVVAKIIERFLTTNSEVIVTSRILYSKDYKPICLLPHFEERDIIASFKSNIDQYKAFILSRFFDMASGSAMYFSKKIIKEMNYFDDRYLLWEDGPFLAKYLQKGKLEFAYDIISIWYEAGGISSQRMEQKSTDKVSSSFYKLQKDYEFFIKNERLERLELFTYSQRKMIDYRNKRFIYRDSLFRYFLYIIYFREFVHCLSYALKRRKRFKTDLIEILKVLNTH